MRALTTSTASPCRSLLFTGYTILKPAVLIGTLYISPLMQYEGTHNFHNFTVRKPATAPDAKRYMLSFRCGRRQGAAAVGALFAYCGAGLWGCWCVTLAWRLPAAAQRAVCCPSQRCIWRLASHATPPSTPRRSCPGVFEIAGQRWVRLVVIGQSFMLHQIRKMVG